jgi:hypothetical protein
MALVFQELATSSFYCSFGPRKCVSGCAKARGREKKPRGKCGDSPPCRYDGFQWRKSKAPSSNFTEMVAVLVLDPEGDGRGGYGVFTEGFKRARELLEGE